MQTAVLDHFSETPTVTVLRYTKPDGFNYLPGQFINLELDIPDCDERCNKRNFSLLSIPSDDYLMIATRHGVSKFKQTSEQMKKGDQIKFSGPFGRFVFNENRVPAVMLSGGIGITPLHAMIKHATYKQLPKPITLFYSNATAGDIPFKENLDEYHAGNMVFTACYTLTGKPPPDWKGKRGRIDAQMIKESAPDWQESEFYISGPTQMVSAMKKLVFEMGIPVERIKSEMFTGY